MTTKIENDSLNDIVGKPTAQSHKYSSGNNTSSPDLHPTSSTITASFVTTSSSQNKPMRSTNRKVVPTLNDETANERTHLNTPTFHHNVRSYETTESHSPSSHSIHSAHQDDAMSHMSNLSQQHSSTGTNGSHYYTSSHNDSENDSNIDVNPVPIDVIIDEQALILSAQKRLRYILGLLALGFVIITWVA